ncbi:DnaD domain protein, partial [bacterium]|nr:DnaD domain protein [bacterium]
PTAFPTLFFSDLLPMIDDLAELKVTLFCFWALHQKEGRFRYLRLAEFKADATLCEGMHAANPDSEPGVTLEAALNRAVQRGTLLCEEVALDAGNEKLYFVNTALGRAAIDQLKAGEWRPGNGETLVEILPERPNIYKLYEQNIGSLTPIISDALKDAEKDYPLEWIQDAIQVAAEESKRNWRYIQGILKRWELEGKSRGINGRSVEQDGQSYLKGKYTGFIEH